MVLVKLPRTVAIRLGGLRSDNPDQTLHEEPDDDGETHLAVSRDKVRSVVQMLVVDDRRDAEQEDGERQRQVDDLMLTESGVLGGRSGGRGSRLQRLDG